MRTKRGEVCAHEDGGAIGVVLRTFAYPYYFAFSSPCELHSVKILRPLSKLSYFPLSLFNDLRLHYPSMASTSPGKVRIGISGWTYKPWRGVFYPEDLKQKLELEYASRTFNSIEINGTFYSLQRPPSFERWAAETPDDFVFSVKAPRFITHIRRLKDAKAPLANFLASGLFRLGAEARTDLVAVAAQLHLQRPEVLEDFSPMLLPHVTRRKAMQPWPANMTNGWPAALR